MLMYASSTWINVLREHHKNDKTILINLELLQFSWSLRNHIYVHWNFISYIQYFVLSVIANIGALVKARNTLLYIIIFFLLKLFLWFSWFCISLTLSESRTGVSVQNLDGKGCVNCGAWFTSDHDQWQNHLLLYILIYFISSCWEYVNKMLNGYENSCDSSLYVFRPPYLC